jgi:predicted nucleotidyltransferase
MNGPTKKSNDKPQVSREKAIEVAKILYLHKHVHDVLLFGSLVQVGIGNDIDLIIITSRERAKQFLTIIDIVLPQRVYTHKRLRREIAAEVLEEHFDELLIKAKEEAGADLDILIFPPDWRDHLLALQKVLHSEPEFIENIVRDAISIIDITS